jgi:hypothetical protein
VFGARRRPEILEFGEKGGTDRSVPAGRVLRIQVVSVADRAVCPPFFNNLLELFFVGLLLLFLAAQDDDHNNEYQQQCRNQSYGVLIHAPLSSAKAFRQ